MTSIHDVARRAGVSTATVSRALRGVDRVSEATRERVVRAASELHYVASPTATSLATGRTGVVGVLAPYLSRWYFANALDGIERRLRQHDLHVLMFNVGERGETRSLLLDLQLLHKRLDALLVVSCDLEHAEVAVLGRLGIPVATISVAAGDWDMVSIDDVAAADTAMTHLLDLGHRRIAYVGGNLEQDVHLATAVDREAGVRRALDRAGIPQHCVPRVVGDWTVLDGERAGEELLRPPDRPTAIMAASDEMAMGILLAARRHAVAVPEQLSVIGVDDHEMSHTHDLTTIAQPVVRQGEVAAQMLVDALNRRPANDTPPPPRRVEILPTTLMVRGTTAPPPTADVPQAGPKTLDTRRS